MRIAFISYEFPPDTAIGGIGTYTYQISICLARLGCDIEVFAGSNTRTLIEEKTNDGVTVHRLKVKRREELREQVGLLLKKRHQQKPFDIIESPEYGAEGLHVKKYLPNIPLVVKFHSPNFLIRELNHSLKKHRLKYKLKAAFLGWGKYSKLKDVEYSFTLQADALVSPCEDLKRIIHERWNIPSASIAVIPNPYIPKADFITIPAKTYTNRVSYIGRLEARKGVHLLAQALPKVLEKRPDVQFRFIGKTNIGPFGKGTMLAYLNQSLKEHLKSIEFVDHVAPEAIPSLLQQTDVCVFPSLWENFPNVCLEAMSAARGVVVSQFGGMYEMITDISGGIAVNPFNAEQLANAILDMLNNPEKRIEMAERSREKIVHYYADEVPRNHLAFYKKVVAHFQKKVDN